MGTAAPTTVAMCPVTHPYVTAFGGPLNLCCTAQPFQGPIGCPVLITDCSGSTCVDHIAYTEVHSGTCISVSRAKCSTIASQRGLSIYILDLNNVLNPMGCFIHNGYSPNNVWFNKASTG